MSQLNRSEIVTNGCPGHCCAAFHLPFTPEEFDRLRAAVMAKKRNIEKAENFGNSLDNVNQDLEISNIESEYWIDRNGHVRGILNPLDIEFILDMIIFLRYDPISIQDGKDMTEEFKRLNPNKEPYDGVANGHLLKDGKLHGIYYTCKHYDKENKLCTVYDQRPQLCRHHGVGNKCEYQGCQINCNNNVVCNTER